jgi:hypothetical protein
VASYIYRYEALQILFVGNMERIYVKNPHSLQELKRNMKEKLTIFQDKSSALCQEIFRSSKACLEAGSWHLKTLL